MTPLKKVILGMSGGVDSSLAAHLLKEQGYDPVGITLSLWEDGSRCCSEEDAARARKVCGALNIPHYTICHASRFKREVVGYFQDEYARGRTPNPCVVCNEKIKFRMLLSKAMEMGIDYIATGHYARIEKDLDSGIFLLKRARDKEKDQSYFLATLSQAVLRRVIFPLGATTKEEVREKAAKEVTSSDGWHESQDICFVKEGERASFLEARIGKREGHIVGEDGNVIGSHSGIHRYTIGQRKGLGVSRGYPLYVIALDHRHNRVIVGPERSLYKKIAKLAGIRLLAPLGKPRLQVMAKIRYGSPAKPAVFEMSGETEARLTFLEPQKAITPGQLAVAYVDDTVYASGWIMSVD